MLLLTTASPLSAQLLLQEGFEVESCVPVNLNCEAGLFELVDANNCLNGWSRWYGRPTIRSNNNPPEGQQCLSLSYDLPDNLPPNILSSGVIADITPVSTGDEVKLSLQVYSSGSSSFMNPFIRIELASAVQPVPLPNQAFGCLQVPPNANSSQILVDLPRSSLVSGWQMIELPCTIANGNYDQLLISLIVVPPFPNDGQGGGLFAFDDIQLQKEPTFTEPTATITNITGDLCSGDALSVTYEICSDEDVILDFAPFASPASISMIPPSQSASVSSGMCKTFTFTYNETTELPLGAPITLGLNYTVSYDGSVCGYTSTGTLSQSLEKYCFAEEACLPDAQPFYALSGGNFTALLSEGLLPPAQAATTPQFLYFEGDAVVDFASYTFAQGSILYFDEGVELTVPNGNSLEGLKSEFNGCERMWKGITVEGGGSLSIESCTVSGAQYGSVH